MSDKNVVSLGEYTDSDDDTIVVLYDPLPADIEDVWVEVLNTEKLVRAVVRIPGRLLLEMADNYTASRLKQDS